MASVKLTLNGAGAITALKDVGKEGEKAAKKVESAFKGAGLAGLEAISSWAALA